MLSFFTTGLLPFFVNFVFICLTVFYWMTVCYRRQVDSLVKTLHWLAKRIKWSNV